MSLDLSSTDIEEYRGLVCTLANKYARKSGLDVEDLIQDGMLGLLQAASKFDPSKGVQFATHAWWWVRAAIARSVAKMRSLADGCSRYVIVKRISHQAPLSLDAPGHDETRGTLGDTVSTDADSPDQMLGDAEEMRLLRFRMDELSERTRTILKLRFFEEMTLSEVGATVGLSRARVGQIETEGLNELRQRYLL